MLTGPLRRSPVPPRGRARAVSAGSGRTACGRCEAIFAFMLTFIREIIKDCEDVAGDQAFGTHSLPVVLGLKAGRMVAFTLVIITFLTLCYIQYIQQQWNDTTAFIYVSLFIQLPLIFLGYKTATASSKKNDRFNSTLTKIIMITGIISMVVFYFSFN
jgi:4-hydroxybenzoate polyprenyltransferase